MPNIPFFITYKLPKPNNDYPSYFPYLAKRNSIMEW